MTDAERRSVEALMKNGNYIHDSAGGVFGVNACPVGDCLDHDPLGTAARMEASHSEGAAGRTK